MNIKEKYRKLSTEDKKEVIRVCTDSLLYFRRFNLSKKKLLKDLYYFISKVATIYPVETPDFLCDVPDQSRQLLILNILIHLLEKKKFPKWFNPDYSKE